MGGRGSSSGGSGSGGLSEYEKALAEEEARQAAYAANKEKNATKDIPEDKGPVSKAATQSALLHYQGDGFDNINTALRHGKPLSERDRKAVSDLDKSMKKATSDTERYRGYGDSVRFKKFFENAEVGDTYTNKGFTSTSSSKTVAFTHFADKYSWKETVKVSASTKQLNVNKTVPKSAWNDEKEHLLQRNLTFKVVSIDKVNKTVTTQVVK